MSQKERGLVIDLEKGFDNINNEILLRKMSSIGFSAQSMFCFETYLSYRNFQVSIKNKFSNIASIKYGVPQGSILGPLLSLLYVNDIQAVDWDLLLYADDSRLVYQDWDVKEIEQKRNTIFSKVCDWPVDNKLRTMHRLNNFLIF